MKNRKWAVSQIPSLKGKTILITGANSGLGYACAELIASKGAKLIMACRNREKGIEAQRKIQKKFKETNIEVMQLDMADLSSICLFAEEFHNKHNRLDILINNAGIMITPWELTIDGIEKIMATNYFGHYALTGHLLDLIIQTPSSRIVSVSSLIHGNGKISHESINHKNKSTYSAGKTYSNSKLALLLFSKTLQMHFDQHNIKSISVAAHPGASITNLVIKYVGKLLFKIIYPLAIHVIQSPEKGARSILRAAVDNQVKGGEYYGPCGLFGMWGEPCISEPNSKSNDKKLMAFLWKESEKITGVRYVFQ